MANKKTSFGMRHTVGLWDMVFSLVGNKVTVDAVNMATNEKLTYPEDYDRLCELLPHDCWPQFAAQLNTHEHNQYNNPTLFDL